jgi:Bacterial Ig-like domain (group 3)
MSYFGRNNRRASRPNRRAVPLWVLEPLEGRTVLSTSAGAAAALPPIPTTTVLLASTTSAETSQSITFTASVDNANRNVPVTSGKIRFVVLAPKPILLAQVNLNKQGEAGITTTKLDTVGAYQIEAQYVPNTTRIAKSVATPVTVTVSPLTAVSFLVTPSSRHGKLNKPVSFTVTALDAQKQPLTNYTGTVIFTSPTDSWTTLARGIYVSLHLSPPPPQTSGLASFPITQYTFTPADHGTHQFIGGVTFGKGGAEVLKVSQANNKRVFGKTTFAIG